METRIEEDTDVPQSADAPQTVDEARDAVQRSRQRISSTLDALEERIVEKKHEIQERVDVMRPVREQISERPFAAVTAGLFVGALLGSLGGGDDDDHTHRRSGRVSGRLTDEDRDELRRWRRERKQRLRAAMKRQHARGGLHREDAGRSSRDEDDGSRFNALKHQLMGAVTSAITTALTSQIRRLASQNVGSLVQGIIGGEDHDGQPGRGRPTSSYDTSMRDKAGSRGRGTPPGNRYAERESYP
jgi:ElaB/YqjD/DUF883 family membrane-anchored ribosome-binding protein